MVTSVQDGLHQPLTVSAERVWDEQSLISRWLESGEAKPPRQDLVGLCRTGLWGVGYVKNLSSYLKKKNNTSSWAFTSQYRCPEGWEMCWNSVRCAAFASGLHSCGQALGLWCFEPLELVFSKLFP